MDFRSARLKRAEIRINVLPLIEVLLTLLLFFAVSSTFIVQRGVRVELPEAKAGVQKEDREMRVTISADGSVYLGQARTSVQELPALLRSGPTSGLLIIEADQAVRHGLVVQVMDAAKSAGIARLAIATRLKAAP